MVAEIQSYVMWNSREQVDAIDMQNQQDGI